MVSLRLRSPFVVLTLLFVLSLPAVTPRIFASDEIHYFAFLRSLWFDRDLSFDNEYRYFHDRGIARAHGFEEAFLERTTATGLRINFGTVGAALLWSPAYAVADAAVVVARAAGSTVPRDGYSWPYLAAVCYASALYGFLSLILGITLARELAPTTPSTAAEIFGASAIWWGTPLLFYMYLSPVMAHASSAFMAGLVLLIWLRVRRHWSVAGAALLGAAAGLMVMVREQDLFFLPPIALDYLLSAWPGWRRRDSLSVVQLRAHVLAGLACVAAGTLVYVPQALAYLALYGRIGPSPLVSRKMFWHAPNAASVLVSPEHGLLAWTPLVAIVVSVAVYTVLSRTSGTRGPGSPLGALLLLACACHVYIAGSVGSWTSAGAFGQRRFISLTPVLVAMATVGVATMTARAWRVYVSAASLAVCWNLSLILQFSTGLMDRQRLDVGRAAYNTVVVLPGRVPHLVARFFFDRSSYYQKPR